MKCAWIELTQKQEYETIHQQLGDDMLTYGKEKRLIVLQIGEIGIKFSPVPRDSFNFFFFPGVICKQLVHHVCFV